MVAAKPFPVPQGSQVLVRQTAELVQSLGHEVHVVVYGYGAGETPAGLRVHRSTNVPGGRKTLAGPSWAKPFQDGAMVRILRRVIREHGIDIVHAHNYEGLLVALVAGHRPIVYHAHTCMRDELPYFIGPEAVTRGVGAWLDRTLPQRADAVVTLHERARGYLIEQGCAPDQVMVVPPPLDPELVMPVVEPGEHAEILYTGNLDRYQNLELLERAMNMVRQAEPRARLHVATADPRAVPFADIRTEVKDVASLREVLSRDVVFACPRSSWSGYPIKLVNAMAAGKAIVACAGGAHGLRDGETARVTPDGDARAFAEALLELMWDGGLRRRLGERAQRVAFDEHGPGQIGGKLDEIYRKVCGF